MLIFGQVMSQNGLQNINYSIYGHTFFGYNSAICCLIGQKLFLVTQETIIYRLVMRNHECDAFLKKILFLAGKMGVATTVVPKPKGFGALRPNQKVGPLGEPFGSIVNLETCFQKFEA